MIKNLQQWYTQTSKRLQATEKHINYDSSICEENCFTHVVLNVYPMEQVQ